jgi:hypothetical protein
MGEVVSRALACTRVAESRDPATALLRRTATTRHTHDDHHDEAALDRRLEGVTMLEADEHMVVFKTSADEVVVVFRSVAQV